VTGLPATTRVVAGIHDSNAGLLPHLLARQPPFAVLSTGTWMVVFAIGGAIDRLDPDRDCLANVDAFGRAVPSSRFMAGREYQIMTGVAAEASESDVARVVAGQTMALPTFAPGTGPFGRASGRWTSDPSRLSAGERTVVASLYAALVTETCLSLTGAGGPIVVEGPFAQNGTFLAALAQLTQRPVIGHRDATGTTEGAALLAEGPHARVAPSGVPVAPLAVDLAAYAAEWRERVIRG
jgi:sugar (pentulose or hexulose) kinase